MSVDPSPIERLTESLLVATSAGDRDRALLDAATSLCLASWAELWRRVDGPDGPVWIPILSRGELDAAPDRGLVRETLAGRFGGGLPNRGFVVRDDDTALALGEVRATGPELDVLEGLLILRAAVDAPGVSSIEALVAPSPALLRIGARFSVQATRALLDPTVDLVLEGEPEGAELDVGAEALAALLLDLGSVVRGAGPESGLRVTRSGAAGPWLELVARLARRGSSDDPRAEELLARARLHGLDAERDDDDFGTTLTLRLPIVNRDAA
ncbi:hypothetical protein [Engelhardtia mirabilis]|uniref:Uncharacterized protein n=1 Tax=Engelhardtia mirabilis TaxID=2528011 RepID=A0A518BL74_9BACT|nr:hypothetical protein Pla133_28210 [Planctomycetes bacterium Pla133]QDV02058.1 hypothetical protein Pla86_28200 [Planctomycetes bacterium Pla86]